MTTGLQNKRVIITAAATGIGRVTAESFLDAGAKVQVCDVDEAGLKDFKSKHPAVGAMVADVADSGSACCLHLANRADDGVDDGGHGGWRAEAHSQHRAHP